MLNITHYQRNANQNHYEVLQYILAWKILWTEEPGELQSTGSQRVGLYWATNTLHFSSWLSWLFISWMQKPVLCYHGSISERGFYGIRENNPVFSKTFQDRRVWKTGNPSPSSWIFRPEAVPSYGSSGPVYSASYLSPGRGHTEGWDGDWTPEGYWMDQWWEDVALAFTWQAWIPLDISQKNLWRDNVTVKWRQFFSLGDPCANPRALQISTHRHTTHGKKRILTEHLLKLRDDFEKQRQLLRRTFLRWHNPRSWNNHFKKENICSWSQSLSCPTPINSSKIIKYLKVGSAISIFYFPITYRYFYIHLHYIQPYITLCTFKVMYGVFQDKNWKLWVK